MSVRLLRTQSQFSNHSRIGWSCTVPRRSAFGNRLTGTRRILGPQWVDTCRMPTFASNLTANWRCRPLCASIDYVHISWLAASRGLRT